MERRIVGQLAVADVRNAINERLKKSDKKIIRNIYRKLIYSLPRGALCIMRAYFC